MPTLAPTPPVPHVTCDSLTFGTGDNASSDLQGSGGDLHGDDLRTLRNVLLGIKYPKSELVGGNAKGRHVATGDAEYGRIGFNWSAEKSATRAAVRKFSQTDNADH